MGVVSAFLRSVIDGNGNSGFGHWCPGCLCAHIFWVGSKLHPVWTFNGDVEKPTFSPSMRSFVPADAEDGTPEQTLCHYFLTAGIINFLADSSCHALRGNVPLPPFPTNYVLE